MSRIMLTALLSLALCSTSLNAMFGGLGRDPMETLIIDSAAEALDKTSSEIRNLQMVDASEIVRVTQVECTGTDVERYRANLAGGDLLTVECYYAGIYKGQVNCQRLVSDAGSFVFLPVGQRYFDILKDMHAKQQARSCTIQ